MLWRTEFVVKFAAACKKKESFCVCVKATNYAQVSVKIGTRKVFWQKVKYGFKTAFLSGPRKSRSRPQKPFARAGTGKAHG